MKTKLYGRLLIIVISAGLFFLLIGEQADAAKKKKKETVLTIIELQSMLMGYADQFNNTLFDAFLQFDQLNPSPNARLYILNDMVYTQASMFTLAAEPNPEKSLLDMVVVTTLGRLIYRDSVRRMYGKPVEKMTAAYWRLEKEIRKIIKP